MSDEPWNDIALDEGAAGAEPERHSFFARAGMVFFSPGALGDSLRAHPAWGVPALAVGIVFAITTWVIPPDVWVEFNRAQMMAFGAGDQPQISGEVFRWGSTIGGFVSWWVILFVFSGILAVVFAFILGDEGRYKQYLSAQAHAGLIGALGLVVAAPLKIAQRDPQLTLSVGTFMEGMLEEGFLLFFFRGLDLFGIWSWVVLGILISRIDRERSAGSAITIIMVMMFGLIAVFSWFGASRLA